MLPTLKTAGGELKSVLLHRLNLSSAYNIAWREMLVGCTESLRSDLHWLRFRKGSAAGLVLTVLTGLRQAQRHSAHEKPIQALNIHQAAVLNTQALVVNAKNRRKT